MLTTCPQLLTSILMRRRHSLFVEGKTDVGQSPLYHGYSVDIFERNISRMKGYGTPGVVSFFHSICKCSVE